MDLLVAILWMGGFYGGIWLIATIFELIGKHFENIRDQAAKDVFSAFNYNEESKYIEELVNKSKLSKLKFFYKDTLKKVESSENPLMANKIINSIVRNNSIGKLCPQCRIGHLVERVGSYGRFVGCSHFPSCHYTLPFRRYIKIKRENNKEEIIDNIKKAYFKV